MLRELHPVRQIKGEARRRWFADRYFDLIVWFAEDGSVAGFQLCYDKEGRQRALTWKRAGGYSHTAVDEGDRRPGRYKSTPILVADGVFERDSIVQRFHQASRSIEPAIADLVQAKLRAHSS